MEVIHGYWECHRCHRSGQLPTTPAGDWAGVPENAEFVEKHIRECFTPEEFEAGVSNEDFFVGTLKIRSG